MVRVALIGLLIVAATGMLVAAIFVIVKALVVILPMALIALGLWILIKILSPQKRSSPS